MLPITNLSYLLPMCCSFWEKMHKQSKNWSGVKYPLKVVGKAKWILLCLRLKWANNKEESKLSLFLRFKRNRTYFATLLMKNSFFSNTLIKLMRKIGKKWSWICIFIFIPKIVCIKVYCISILQKLALKRG